MRKNNLSKLLGRAKGLWLFSLLTLFPLSASAQHEEGDVTVQARVGMNLSTMTDYNRAKFGYVFGMEMEYHTTDYLSLSAAILYSDQGAVDKDDSGKVELDLDFVNVPVMLNWYVLPGLALKAGIQPGFRTKATARTDGVKADVDQLLNQLSTEQGETVEMRKFMLSVPMGLSFEYRNIVLDARYNLGVTPILKGGDDYHNSVFQLTLGYKFPIEF